ncbi:prostaglandin D2 receptor 2 [Latimeria chalumnae]|uniref:prostaglandin D2 receptor 2 n=1 Tax=Latimeria chalumnae TaxID=7897 RepID=UPI0003C15D4E|nr:PREDICTED: prostaglandin D2 receptor 2 [Latimeria chalumnae]XP_006013637.1 PREDICTED: prostaglandin D2 receptor 2 [Latimeria chalumnae]XP_014339435.1 PREDICTED: prostaglandin D2 receptor 2 [Latimeria chalumnae]|eukprot:XP_006013636.1 PREDICTED: prostaglandin D2 receptor 2 [Latimeria chalumnae]
MANKTQLCSIISDMTMVRRNNSATTAIDYASVCIHGIVSVFGVAENVIIIWIIGYKLRRTVITMWIFNLALSDLMVTLSLPFFTYFLASGHTWNLGNIFCRIHSSIFFLNMFVSGFLLSAISIDRCLLVVVPIWAQNHRNVKTASYICIGIWVISIINTMPYFVFRSTIERQDGRIMCYYNFLQFSPSKDIHDLCGFRQYAFAASKLVIAFLVPLVIITISYIGVSLKIRQRHRKRSGRFFKLMVTVIVTFIVCWSPYHIFSILEAESHYQTHLRPLVGKGLPFVTSLAFINSIINPCLYVFTCPDFMTKIRRSLRSVLESVLVEDTEVFMRKSTIRNSSVSSELPIKGYKFIQYKDTHMSDDTSIIH